MSHARSISLFAAAALSHPLAAQESAPVPIQIESPVPDKDLYAQLTIDVGPRYVSVHDPAGPLRPPMVKTKPQEWFTATSPLVAAYRQQPETMVSASAWLAIDATGTVTACDFRADSVLPLAADELCTWLGEKPRFHPALAQDGTPTRAEARIALWYARRSVAKGAPPPGFFAEALLSPAPPPPPPPLSSMPWPPEHDWLLAHSSPFMASVRPVRLPAENATGARWVGIFFGAADSSRPGCEVLESGGDQRVDKAACKWVSKELKPRWNIGTPAYMRHGMMLVLVEGKSFSYTVPDRSADPRVELRPETRNELYDLIMAASGAVPVPGPTNLTVGLSVNAQGQAVACRLSVSSGSDAGDVAACNILKQRAWFVPTRDMFGRPANEGFYNWSAAREASVVNRPAPGEQ
ncbi:hypothetical protein LY632_03720 [Erythrobacter sp. SDW2]|uniref:hypothetical protein n=1 Tax=Erythrobacter sp. SDW2 TaxID=2907154 RepID=UPI001F2B9E88|nr:hypothetical protein [Erythrobacter sp. SDW2]UIP07517.1 hypothetical protein LY632_03720 [Erythrobacter sp. SDW2]